MVRPTGGKDDLKSVAGRQDDSWNFCVLEDDWLFEHARYAGVAHSASSLEPVFGKQMSGKVCKGGRGMVYP
jgi:hypothetical protein